MLDPKQPSSQQVQLQPYLAADLLSLGRRRKACIYEAEGERPAFMKENNTPILGARGPPHRSPSP